MSKILTEDGGLGSFVKRLKRDGSPKAVHPELRSSREPNGQQKTYLHVIELLVGQIQSICFFSPTTL